MTSAQNSVMDSLTRAKLAEAGRRKVRGDGDSQARAILSCNYYLGGNMVCVFRFFL